jgi:uncharacterized membrane protein (DUF485 family)
MTQTGTDPAAMYLEIQASREFAQVDRRFRRFAVPTVAGILGWYFAYVLLAACAPGLMAVPIFGRVNLGLCLGVAQIASTLAVTLLYVQWARTRLDPLVDRIGDRIGGRGA